jgi:hypothetical protein
MNIYIPIAIMLISLILIGISIFLLYYYDAPTYALAIFIIGVLLGILACILFIYLRTPVNVVKIEKIEDEEQKTTLNYMNEPAYQTQTYDLQPNLQPNLQTNLYPETNQFDLMF